MNPSTIQRCLLVRVAIGVLMTTAGLALAGPLDPPAGAVSPTGKTLTEIEPRKAINATNTPGDSESVVLITAPGSYYLTGNVMAAPTKIGIKVATSGVTIDLNGYAVLGSVGSQSGISISGNNRSDITIRNGSVKGCGGNGVDMNAAENVRVQSVTAIGNGGAGIVTGNVALVSDCTTSNNLGAGIRTGSTSIIRHCAADNNGQSISNHGIQATDRSEVVDCEATDNAGAGIYVNQGGRVVNCSSGFNTIGVQLYARGQVSGCTCQANTQDGIRAGGGTLVRDNLCSGNGDDGIQLEDDCVVTNNTCMSNGAEAQGAGVYVLGDSCKIDGNTFSFNHYGVLVNNAHTNTFIVRNMTTNNTVNFSVPAGNELAPIITNPGTTFSGTTAWSNFAY